MSEKIKQLQTYTSSEERLNVLTHGLGFVLSVVATGLLVWQATQDGGFWRILSFSVYGFSMLLLYAASTLYHRATQAWWRYRLQIFDHAAIYVLIAGTYTPFTLVTLPDRVGWMLFAASWGFALVGITLKLFYTGRYNLLSTLMYVFMGWMAIFAIQPLMSHLPLYGLLWLLAGGLAYTLGAVLYMIERIPYNHAIFHVFVLLGSFCHFVSVYAYV